MLLKVAPSRGRGSKRPGLPETGWQRLSPPHGGADRNTLGQVAVLMSDGVAPSRGRGSEPRGAPACHVYPWSPPHGGADRNKVVKVNDDILSGRPLTGARIETIFPAPGLVPPRVAPSRGRGSKHVRIAG